MAHNTGNYWNVFVRDTLNGETVHISNGFDGTPANSNSNLPSLSDDGRFIAFSSLASNLISDDTNNKRDIFVYDLQTQEIKRVSIASDGTESNGHSEYPSISPDGRYVAFESTATNIYTDTNTATDIYMHDLETGKTILVSLSSDELQDTADSMHPSISKGGNQVAFRTINALDENDDNNTADIYVRDEFGGAPTLDLPFDYLFRGSSSNFARGEFRAIYLKSITAVIDHNEPRVYDNKMLSYLGYDKDGNEIDVLSGFSFPDNVICRQSIEDCYPGHEGIDFSGRIVTEVLGVAPGTVITPSTNSCYGNNVKVDHGNGFVSLYAHLASVSVTLSQTITSSTVLGTVGDSGCADGAHLHFEFRYETESNVYWLDPSGWQDASFSDPL